MSSCFGCVSESKEESHKNSTTKFEEDEIAENPKDLNFRSIGSQTNEGCSNGKSEKNAGSHRKSGGPPPISFLRYFFLYYLKGKRYVYSV